MNKSEFIAMVERLKNPLFRLSLAIVQDKQTAEDIAQDTFAKLWTIRSDINTNQNVEGLAFTITRNLSLNRLNSLRVISRPKNSDSTNQYLFTPHHELLLKEQRQFLDEIINELPENQKTILHLKNVEGLSHSEIADLMKIESNHVAVLLSRGRKYVLKRLKEYYHEQ